MSTAVATERFCEELTRRRAGNFYYGIRLLPRERRTALCAVYAVARRIDDVADGRAGPARKLEELSRIEEELHTLGHGSRAPEMQALALAGGRYPIPIGAFHDLIAGARMDVIGMRYERYDQLIRYCRLVAGSIGRLALGVFGGGSEAAVTAADDLGVAMQLTNILRDIQEDAAAGRVYLPSEDLRLFGCRIERGKSQGPLELVVRFEAVRAHGWFSSGRRLLPLIDRSCGRCVAALAGTYERLLDRIEADPEAVMRGRVSLPIHVKLWVAARAAGEGRVAQLGASR
jgi:phytoene synthase